MKIALACDHGAYDLKETIKAHLTEKGYEVKDFGCFDKSSCDYPDFAAPAAKAVASGECDMGVLTCTTGIGVSITANKIKGIRCALLSDLMSARLTREHNDTNMMAIGAGVTGEMLARSSTLGSAPSFPTPSATSAALIRSWHSKTTERDLRGRAVASARKPPTL
mgnify:CR=1 FL=1